MQVEKLEVEIIGAEEMVGFDSEHAQKLCELSCAAGDVKTGHLALEFVDAERMRLINRKYRDRDHATDVLSFPIDGTDDDEVGPRELGDILICPEHATDLYEAVVHGALHLVGFDHETDNGEMLTVQAEILKCSN